MAVKTEQTMAEILEARGLTDPKKRAELLEEVHLSCAALTEAAENLRTALEAELEERRYDTTPAWGPSETADIEASARFEEARAAATRFLHEKSGRPDPKEAV